MALSPAWFRPLDAAPASCVTSQIPALQRAAAIGFLCYNYSIMPNELQAQQSKTPETIETEADAQAARLVTERLKEITARVNLARTRQKIGQIMVSISCLTCLWLIPHFVSEHNPLRLTLFYASFSVWGLSFAVMFWARHRTMPKFDAVEIARLGGAKAIVPLFAALQNELPTKQKKAIYHALTQALPQMKASDAGLLTPFAQWRINSWLNSANRFGDGNPPPCSLRIAALKALEQVGNSTAIAVVERLANSEPQTPEQEKIKQAAIECLPMLRANCGEVEAAQTLLRASHADKTDPKTLLRPASGAGQMDKAELLRGTDSPDAPPSEGQA